MLYGGNIRFNIVFEDGIKNKIISLLFQLLSTNIYQENLENLQTRARISLWISHS